MYVAWNETYGFGPVRKTLEEASEDARNKFDSFKVWSNVYIVDELGYLFHLNTLQRVVGYKIDKGCSTTRYVNVHDKAS